MPGARYCGFALRLLGWSPPEADTAGIRSHRKESGALVRICIYCCIYMGHLYISFLLSVCSTIYDIIHTTPNEGGCTTAVSYHEKKTEGDAFRASNDIIPPYLSVFGAVLLQLRVCCLYHTSTKNSRRERSHPMPVTLSGHNPDILFCWRRTNQQTNQAF